MKLTFECVDAGRKSVERENGGKVEKAIVYYASFAKTVEPNMTSFGSFKIESLEPLHFKPMQKYDLNIGDHIDIVIPTGVSPNLKRVH